MLSYATIEYCSGWNEAACLIKNNGLDYAHTILETAKPEMVYNAYISGQRRAAEFALFTNDVPLSAQELQIDID